MRACDFLNTKTKTQSNSNYLNILKKYFLRRSQTNVTQNKIKTNEIGDSRLLERQRQQRMFIR